MTTSSISTFATYCENELKLHNQLTVTKRTDPNLTFFKSLPICIIDAVFSIGVNYKSVVKAEETFIKYFNLDISRTAPTSDEYTINDFIKNMDTFNSFDEAAEQCFNNRQRTSSCNGILKAEACYRVAKVFESHKINTLNDFSNYANKAALDADILKVKGQSSGIMLKYLYMLAGDENTVKPDRHMVNFVRNVYPHVTIATKDHEEIKKIIEDAVTELKATYPDLTVRFLDFLIWEHMSQKGNI